MVFGQIPVPPTLGGSIPVPLVPGSTLIILYILCKILFDCFPDLYIYVFINILFVLRNSFIISATVFLV